MTYKEYRGQWEQAHVKTPNIPLNIDLELSSVCNLACPFCFLSNSGHKQDKRFMDAGLALDIIEEAADIGVPALKFNWRGEATLNPNFSMIVEYAANTRRFHDLLLNTNGNFGQHAIDGVLSCTKIMFSLDSVNEAAYNQIRIGGDILKILNNISICIKSGHKNIWVRRVITENNKHENFKSDVRRIFGNDVKVAEHYCFDRVGREATPEKRVYCGYPSQRLVIAVDGKIYPCCVDYDCTMPVGVAPALMAAWDSSKMRALRNMVKNNCYSPTCENCTSWMAYDSPKRKYVADKEIK